MVEATGRSYFILPRFTWGSILWNCRKINTGNIL